MVLVEAPMSHFFRRWGVSMVLLSACGLLGFYVLWWNNPLLRLEDPFEGSTPSQQSVTTPTEPLLLYRWDTLERMRLVKRKQGETLRVDYERAAPRDPGVWRVAGQSEALRLSDFEQILLNNTLEQLRVLTVRRILLTQPTPEQLQSFGVGDLDSGAIEVILHGQKESQLQEQRLLIGNAAPTGSGYYFYLPALDQVYLGYVNIPEALQKLLSLPLKD